MELKKTAELEALLFASGDPLTLERAAGALYCSTGEVADLLEELQQQYRTAERGIELRKAAGGWQLVTKKETAGLIRRLQEKQEVKLSNAAMETLAIVAFRQPVTKSEMEAIRGVKVDGVLGNLVELGLIAEVGRKEALGRPMGPRIDSSRPSDWIPWKICPSSRRRSWRAEGKDQSLCLIDRKGRVWNRSRNGCRKSWQRPA